MRCRQLAWSWNVDDRATSTSGPSPEGAVHGIWAHVGSSSTGPTYRTFAGSLAGKSKSAEVSTSTRCAARIWSKKLASGSNPWAARRAFNRDRPLLNWRLVTPLRTRSRIRPKPPDTGFNPSPNGGIPGAGSGYGFGMVTANGSPAACAPIMAPKQKKPVTTTSGRSSATAASRSAA